MSGEFADFMSGGFDELTELLGTEDVQFEGIDSAIPVDWNSSGTREELEVHGVVIGVTATIVVKRSALAIPPRNGQRVIRAGVTYVISGTLNEDALSYTLALDSTDIPQ